MEVPFDCDEYEINVEVEQEMTNTLQVKLLSENARMPNEIIRRMQVMTYSQLKLSVLEPQEKAVIKTDVAVSIPEGYVGTIN